MLRCFDVRANFRAASFAEPSRKRFTYFFFFLPSNLHPSQAPQPFTITTPSLSSTLPFGVWVESGRGPHVSGHGGACAIQMEFSRVVLARTNCFPASTWNALFVSCCITIFSSIYQNWIFVNMIASFKLFLFSFRYQTYTCIPIGRILHQFLWKAILLKTSFSLDLSYSWRSENGPLKTLFQKHSVLSIESVLKNVYKNLEKRMSVFLFVCLVWEGGFVSVKNGQLQMYNRLVAGNLTFDTPFKSLKTKCKAKARNNFIYYRQWLIASGWLPWLMTLWYPWIWRNLVIFITFEFGHVKLFRDLLVSKCNQSSWPSNRTGFHGPHIGRKCWTRKR